MINHIRTLLRNADPGPYAGKPGQEIVDPSYRPVTLSSPLATIRAVLFGRQPDQAALDLKLRRYMAVLHATGLASYVYAADPRVTYPAPVLDGLEFDFRPEIMPVGTHDVPLYLSGGPPVEDGGGALRYVWNIVVLTEHAP